jgi:ER membrane protein complex subunit 4
VVAAERKRLSPTVTAPNQTAILAKRKAQAMSLATKPGQQILMNAVMMYMSGSTLNIFTISTTSAAILTPLTSIFRLETMFGKFEEVDTQMAKILYVVLNLVWLAMGMYKMSSMRLLPTTSADFADSIPWKDMMELSSIPPAM